MEAQRTHDVHVLQLGHDEDRRTAIASKVDFLKKQHDHAIDAVVEDCRQDIRDMRARTPQPAVQPASPTATPTAKPQPAEPKWAACFWTPACP